MNAETVILGLGPPRSGTTSLARLLDGCRGAKVTHEAGPRAPWNDGRSVLSEYEQWVAKADHPVWGDVACWHLPAAAALLRRHGDRLRVPVIVRPGEETVRSLLAKGRRYCTADRRPDFPTWPQLTDEAAFRRYWADYVGRALRLTNSFPAQVRLFPVYLLNTTEGQRQIFEFCRIPEPDRKHEIPCHHNGRR